MAQARLYDLKAHPKALQAGCHGPPQVMKTPAVDIRCSIQFWFVFGPPRNRLRPGGGKDEVRPGDARQAGQQRLRRLRQWDNVRLSVLRPSPLEFDDVAVNLRPPKLPNFLPPCTSQDQQLYRWCQRAAE